MRCGATDLRRLRKTVLEEGADWGFAFDGDADRVQAVDARGRSVDGDKLMVLLALLHEPYRRDGRLVFTQMTNRGVERYLRENGIRTYRTAVGDSAVLRAMRRRQIKIGGEQCGHIICWDQTCCGDGILVSLLVSELLTRHGLSLGDFAGRIPTYPQVQQNVPLADPQGWQRDERLRGRLQRLRANYEPEVRFCVRPSGTESLVRIMTEASKLALARRANAEVAELFAAYRRK
ncbi:MAG: hypothetical protein A2Y63_05340 [Candidatus Riflebacteria bacterium RBG_13_59_9]|nr:MAG: hypothetical protein A2Y63_05340 [Candidatus Riflebacteria bacterium RBG_13_59_9]